MGAVTVIGLDIAKSVFQVLCVNAEGKVIIRRQLKRRYVLPFFEKLPPCLVGIEARASSFNYPQFRPLRWLPIPDPSNETILSTSPRYLVLDPLLDSGNRLASQSLSGNAKASWLEAPF
jgi:hypothetical protein